MIWHLVRVLDVFYWCVLCVFVCWVHRSRLLLWLGAKEYIPTYRICNIFLVTCHPAYEDELVTCLVNGAAVTDFTRNTTCKYTNGYQHKTAILLSVFLGIFGVDRFYLGYPGMGLIKLSTCGMFFVGYLTDIILIATHSLRPSDGSHYVVDYFGTGLDRIVFNWTTDL